VFYRNVFLYNDQLHSTKLMDGQLRDLEFWTLASKRRKIFES
jgi:hypothetical protein